MNALVTDLDTLRRLAAERRDEFEVMRYMLEFRDDIPDEQLDALVDAAAAPIVDAIDCTQCANCCRSLDVYLTPDDAQHLADGLFIPLETLEIRHVDHHDAEQVGEWGKFNQTPCPFLSGKLCSVYSRRPETCRTYPAFTPDFRWVLDDIIDGAELCPIIYNVLVAMVDEVEKL
jgi:uncharacterized protein